jgi:hypothetical protein
MELYIYITRVIEIVKNTRVEGYTAYLVGLSSFTVGNNPFKLTHVKVKNGKGVIVLN